MKIRYNDPCPCGSGKTLENCCLGKQDGSDRPNKTDTAQTYDAIAYEVRIESIKHLIEDFGSRHLTREYTGFALNLCDKISLTTDLDILRGRKTIWAAAIIHVIARLNFLFDTNSELVLTPALICSHFKTLKSTVGNRASQIQKTCRLLPGTKGFCRQKTGDATPPAAPSEERSPPAITDDRQMKLFDE